MQQIKNNKLNYLQNSFKRNLIKIDHHYQKNHQQLWNLPKFTSEPERKFTGGEVQAAIKQMQNNKSAERDNINQNILNMEQKAPQKVL